MRDEDDDLFYDAEEEYLFDDLDLYKAQTKIDKPKVSASQFNFDDDYEDDFPEDAFLDSLDEGLHDWEEDTADLDATTPVDPYVITSIAQTENVEDNTVILDADNYAFQFKNGEWFMAGATYGATEFSGTFPARKLR